MTKPDRLLWLNDARGVYIPRDFAQSFGDRAKHVAGVSDENWTILDAGPDHEYYWDVWDEVLTNAVVTDDAGVKYTLHQDGDCWLIPDGMQWSDEKDTFVWPDDEEDSVMDKMTPETLREIAEQRETWAADAEARDLHGSAKEWRLTASIARQLADLLEGSEQDQTG
jgi:hypothetical protein